MKYNGIFCFNKKLPAVLFFLIITIFNSRPQSVQDLEKYQAVYHDKSAIILNDKENIDITVSGGKISIINHITSEKYFLKDKSQAYSNEYIYFSFYNIIKNIKANYYKIEDGKYARHNIPDVNTSSYLDDNVFFSDTRKSQVVYPAIEKGARTFLSYDKITTDPHYSQVHYFAEYLPIVNSEVTLTFPESVEVGYVLYNDDSAKVKFSEKKIKNKTIYTWKTENMSELEDESDAPNIRYYTPHIIIYIKKYYDGKKENTVFSGLDDLYKWYYSFVKDINKDTLPAMKKTVDSLTFGVADTLVKIKNIYYWAQEYINYIAIEDKLQGLIPMNGSDVFLKRYGDCKGMSSLLQAMLRIAGIKSYLAWIGTRDLPYSYSLKFTPVVDNHMITAVPWHNDYIFLDATSNFNPFPKPTAFIQGKEVLIGLDENNYDLKVIPVTPIENNFSADTLFVKLKGNVITGHGISRIRGYNKESIADNLEGLSGTRLETYLKDLLEIGNNKFKLESYHTGGFSSNDSDAIITCTFSIPDYVTELENHLYINLHLDKIFSNDYIDLKKKKYDREIRYKTSYYSIVKFDIPEDYIVENIPESSEYSNQKFGYKITFKVLPGKIIENTSFYINTLMVHKADFADWNKMIEKLNIAYNQVVTIKRNN